MPKCGRVLICGSPDDALEPNQGIAEVSSRIDSLVCSIGIHRLTAHSADISGGEIATERAWAIVALQIASIEWASGGGSPTTAWGGYVMGRLLQSNARVMLVANLHVSVTDPRLTVPFVSTHGDSYMTGQRDSTWHIIVIHQSMDMNVVVNTRKSPSLFPIGTMFCLVLSGTLEAIAAYQHEGRHGGLMHGEIERIRKGSGSESVRIALTDSPAPTMGNCTSPIVATHVDPRHIRRERIVQAHRIRIDRAVPPLALVPKVLSRIARASVTHGAIGSERTNLEVPAAPAPTSETLRAAAHSARLAGGRNDQTSERTTSRGSSHRASWAVRPCNQRRTRSEAMVSDFSGRNALA